ncbi:transposon DNA-invertase Bin3 domain protein [Staphylococcus capitis VCU116]|nr:transposon DNA-invertase Bin3 domain protein [Staphylococcus capitis VCU116]
MIIGYTRVSSIDQNLESHLKILKVFGTENIYRKTFTVNY